MLKSLERRDPFAIFDSFDSLFNTGFNTGRFLEARTRYATPTSLVTNEIKDTGEQEAVFNVAGFNPEDVTVEFIPESQVIKVTASKTEKSNSYIKETLNASVVVDSKHVGEKATATVDNGLLVVVIPLDENARKSSSVSIPVTQGTTTPSETNKTD